MGTVASSSGKHYLRGKGESGGGRPAPSLSTLFRHKKDHKREW